MENKKRIKELAQNYFNQWNKNDTSYLVDIFTDEVEFNGNIYPIIVDWAKQAIGHDAVMEMNQFEDDIILHAHPLSIDVIGDTAYCDLIITVSKIHDFGPPELLYELRVMDVINFSPGGKVMEITAYKGAFPEGMLEGQPLRKPIEN